MRILLKSKIHKATVTDANLNYEGSITIDETLIEKADLWEGEQVMVVSNTNGSRLFTYVLKGEKDSGIICMNGASAHHIKKGDEIIIMAFEVTEIQIKPKKLLVDKNNQFVRLLS